MWDSRKYLNPKSHWCFFSFYLLLKYTRDNITNILRPIKQFQKYKLLTYLISLLNFITQDPKVIRILNCVYHLHAFFKYCNTYVGISRQYMVLFCIFYTYQFAFFPSNTVWFINMNIYSSGVFISTALVLACSKVFFIV